MKNNNPSDATPVDICIPLYERIAYNQAGQAAAIYLNNHLRHLPVPAFTITKYFQRCGLASNPFSRLQPTYNIEIEGGRIIKKLPLSFPEATKYYSPDQKEEFRHLLESDVINLLAGPLSEAKFAALHDDEIFNANLVNISSLRFYTGHANLALVNDYMNCFRLGIEEYERKLKELFLSAYNFINDDFNWRSICSIAEYILNEPSKVIKDEEIGMLLKLRLAA